MKKWLQSIIYLIQKVGKQWGKGPIVTPIFHGLKTEFQNSIQDSVFCAV